MRQSLNFFSKLFSSANPTSNSPDKTKHIQHLRTLFSPEAEIFTYTPLFNNQDRYNIKYMMIHPFAGVILFNYFDYDATELKGVTASAAKKEDTNDADIKTNDAKTFIMHRFDEIFHTQLSPVLSVLICSNLNESDFDLLDESFHALIPKGSTLFNDAKDEDYKNTLIKQTEIQYDLKKIKRALFAELVIPKTRSLMTTEQEAFVHNDAKEHLLLQGLPGTGKSATLIAKALYEKMKNPELKLLILGKRVCNAHSLQALIFAFIENSHWGLNPAEIDVSNFETIRRRCSEKEKYDLVLCDDINGEDISALLKLLNNEGRLLASSHYEFDTFETEQKLTNNFRLSPALCAACEGLRVDNLKNNLSFSNGNIYMNVILTVAALLKEVNPAEITLVHQNKEELLKLQAEVDGYFNPISYLFDDSGAKEGLGLYPISHLPCLLNKYMIIIIDDESQYDPIELISRAQKKTFILSQSEEVYNVVDTIKARLLDKDEESY